MQLLETSLTDLAEQQGPLQDITAAPELISLTEVLLLEAVITEVVPLPEASVLTEELIEHLLLENQGIPGLPLPQEILATEVQEEVAGPEVLVIEVQEAEVQEVQEVSEVLVAVPEVQAVSEVQEAAPDLQRADLRAVAEAVEDETKIIN